MKETTKPYYQALCALLAEHKDHYADAVRDQLAVWQGIKPEKQPLLLHCDLPPTMADRFPGYHSGETHHDKDKMLLEGMKCMLRPALAGGQAVPSIRANMGCGIFPSLFPGILPMLFDDGKMPWVKQHLSRDTIRQLREKDIQLTDEFKMALSHMAYMAERIPPTGAYIFPLDLQGPFDIAHIVYGDAIFYDIYDDPVLMHHLLDLSCYAIELGLTACLQLIPNADTVVAHYNDVVLPRSLGGIKISEDTPTLLSPEHIDQFVMPYTRRILAFFGGGYIHYCGRNDYLLQCVLAQNNVCGINFGNPDKHDMDAVLRQIAAAGKVYYGTVPRHEQEPLIDYFRRVTQAATADGQKRLLLQYFAPLTDKEEVLDTWAKVNDEFL